MRKRLETTDYYLGKLVGEIIYHKYLPTLNVDMLKSPTVIGVTEEERLEVERLNQIMSDTYYHTYIDEKTAQTSHSLAHKNWTGYINTLAVKYLPQKLHCRFERIDVVDMDEFKNGLREYLWDTDLSWYMPEDDFWVNVSKHSWFSEVVLTLKVND
jgi:hypothetical protein